MPSTHDITLAGEGYMIHPGAYKRRQATTDEPAPGTVRLSDFWGGTRRAFQWERDRIWSSVGGWPALDSQGLTAGPKRSDYTETVSPAISPTAARWVFSFNGATYLVQGTSIYKLTQSGASYSGLALVKTFSNPIVSATLVEDLVVLGFGGSVATIGYSLADGTTLNPLFSVTSLKYTALVATDGDLLVLRNPNDPTGLVRVTDLGASSGGSVSLGSTPRRLVTVDGHVWALTEQALWKRVANGDWQLAGTMPPLSRSDDASWAVVSYGRLYSWLGSQVVFYDLTNDVWQPVGLAGQATHGACSMGGWLLVSITSLLGAAELWGFDGHAWWLIEGDTTPGTTYTNPVPVSGAAGVWDLYAGRGTTSQQVALWQLFPKAGAPGLRASWSLSTALLDAGIREQVKSWTSAGVELAWPDARATSGSVTVTLEYSVNGGVSWSTVATASVSGTSSRTATVKGDLPAGTSSKWLQLRVSLSGIVDWSPVVAGLWATYDVGSNGGGVKRRWELDVSCDDRLVLRDSSVETTGARAIARRLWDLWEAGEAVSFRDIDYDLTGDEYTVKVVGIKEVVPKPAEAARWGDGVVSLVLVEV